MVVALGKRKRQGEVFKTSRKAASKPTPKTDIIEEESESDNEDLQAAFRRAFEAKFKPLDGAAKKKAEAIKAIEEEEDDEEESDFGGLSGAEDDDDDDEDDEVEVIELADIKRTPREELDKKQMKAFMVCSLLDTFYVFKMADSIYSRPNHQPQLLFRRPRPSPISLH